MVRNKRPIGVIGSAIGTRNKRPESVHVTLRQQDGTPVPGAPGTPGGVRLPVLMGPPGFDGFDGEPGEAGPPGQGTRGDTGAIGPAGMTGAPGADGFDGEQGEAGIPGAQGARGDTGAVGPAGLAGALGFDGEPGERGEDGIPGPIGPTGSMGPVGPPGAMGWPGFDGEDGAEGLPGPAGQGSTKTFTPGSVLFADANGLPSENNAQFFWDGNRLGIGTADPGTDSGLTLSVQEPSLIVYASLTKQLWFRVINLTNDAAVAAIIGTKADVASQNFQSHASARTVSRFGVTLGGWNEFLAVEGNGLAIGTANAGQKLILGAGSVAVIECNSTGVAKMSGTATRATTEGTNHLDLFDATPPAGTLANGVSLYSNTGEFTVMDAAGNATVLSPHDKRTGEWIFFSKHSVTGKVLRVDIERLVRLLDRVLRWFGCRPFVTEWTEPIA